MARASGESEWRESGERVARARESGESEREWRERVYCERVVGIGPAYGNCAERELRCLFAFVCVCLCLL